MLTRSLVVRGRTFGVKSLICVFPKCRLLIIVNCVDSCVVIKTLLCRPDASWLHLNLIHVFVELAVLFQLADVALSVLVLVGFVLWNAWVLGLYVIVVPLRLYTGLRLQNTSYFLGFRRQL